MIHLAQRAIIDKAESLHYGTVTETRNHAMILKFRGWFNTSCAYRTSWNLILNKVYRNVFP